MSHSYIGCLLQVVFATADRRPCIAKEMHDRLHAYLGGMARENGRAALAVGGTSDHVHVLLSLTRTTSPAQAVQLLKAGSSKWVHEHFAGKGKIRMASGIWGFLGRGFATGQDHLLHPAIRGASQTNQFCR
jgi:REP element-mobilizing transposase RayT